MPHQFAVDEAHGALRKASEREMMIKVRWIKSPHPQDPAAPVTFATRNNRAMIGLAVVGVVAIIAAFLVRFSWPNPILSVLAVMFAVYMGLTGVFLVIFAVGILSSGRRGTGS